MEDKDFDKTLVKSTFFKNQRSLYMDQIRGRS